MLTSNHHPDAALLFLTFVSFFGLFLAALFTVKPTISEIDSAWRRPAVGSMFAMICVLGSLAVFFPNKCAKGFNFGKKEERQSQFYSNVQRDSVTSKRASSVLRGHHPVCDPFSSHVFHLGSRTFCGTCSGLFLGALVSLVGVAAYFFGNWHIGHDAFWVVWVGILGVTLGLAQSPVLKIPRSFIRVFSGALLAIGPFLILVVIDELTFNFFLDIFFLFLTVFWLVTRISFSQWEHETICSACNLKSCDLGHRTKKERLRWRPTAKRV